MVLPDPCRPAISTTVGGCEANFSLAVSLPRISTSSSRTNLDDLLAGRKRGQHLLADGLVLDVVDELLDNFEVDVGLKQRQADLAQRLLHVFFVEGGLAAQGLERALKLFLKILKHRRSYFIRASRFSPSTRTFRQAQIAMAPGVRGHQKPRGAKHSVQCQYW